MSDHRQFIPGLDDLCRLIKGRIDIAGIAHPLRPAIRQHVPGRGIGILARLQRRSPVPDDFQGIAALHRRPVRLGHHPDTLAQIALAVGFGQWNARQADHRLDARHSESSAIIQRPDAAVDHRAARNHSMEHPRHLLIDAEQRLAGDNCPGVLLLLRRPDQRLGTARLQLQGAGG